ncbi:hypothetical protein CKO23_14175 [Thiocystis violacea]|nr:hypothetical protein [Thiocystis violacea]
MSVQALIADILSEPVAAHVATDTPATSAIPATTSAVTGLEGLRPGCDFCDFSPETEAPLPESRKESQDRRKAESRAITGESQESQQSQGSTVASDLRFIETDRRMCIDCTRLEPDGRCGAARRGELPMTSTRYEPITDRLERCVGYQPTSADPDRRPGRERWPNLARRLQEGLL